MSRRYSRKQARGRVLGVALDEDEHARSAVLHRHGPGHLGDSIRLEYPLLGGGPTAGR